MYEDLKGKFALVCGAASKRGMGHDIALRLAKEGCIVGVNGRPGKRKNQDDLIEGWEGINSVVKEIEEMGGKALALPADLTDSAQVNAMFETIDKEWGKIDILIQTQSISNQGYHDVADIEDDVWDRVLKANLYSMFYVGRAAAKRMREQRSGVMVNFSSLHGKIAVPGIGAYTSAKFGVVGLNATLAKELVPYNVRCNCVISGCFATDMPECGDKSIRALMREGMSEDEAIELNFKDTINIIPMKRIGKVEEMSNAVLFLASDASSYITGQAINIDGGFLMEH